MIRNCETCGKEFKTKQSKVDRGGGKFCSIKCRSHGHSFSRNCLRCGKEFHVQMCMVGKNRARFCSLSCKKTPMAERFWSKVNKNGNEPAHVPGIGRCWEWTASKDPLGYGFFRRAHGENMSRAHRVSWELSGQETDGLLVLHRCDNPSCVRPSHLFLGTDMDNCRDRDSKGRANTLRGTANRNSKLTEELVLEIRASKETVTAIARRFGVGWTTVSHVLKRENWRHI